MRALRPSASEHAVLMFLQANIWHEMRPRPSRAYGMRWDCKAPQYTWAGFPHSCNSDAALMHLCQMQSCNALLSAHHGN